jgi:hypothetical protein
MAAILPVMHVEISAPVCSPGTRYSKLAGLNVGSGSVLVFRAGLFAEITSIICVRFGREGRKPVLAMPIYGDSRLR